MTIYNNPCDRILLDFADLARTYGMRPIKDNTNYKTIVNIQYWFNKGNPIYQPLIYITQDRFLAGDIGPICKYPQSILMRGIKNADCKLVNRLFTTDILQFLKNAEYNGPLTIEAAISEDDKYPYFIRFKPGVDTASASCIKDFIKDGNYNRPNRIYLDDNYCFAMAISYQPYPVNGIPTYVVGYHQNWREAREAAYLSIKKDPDLQFRVDAGVQGLELEAIEIEL